MSFVGTRPEATKYVEKYSNEMLATLLLPAGITSEASIRYKDEAELLDLADDVDRAYIEKVLPEKMKYNLQSIKNFCFVLPFSLRWCADVFPRGAIRILSPSFSVFLSKSRRSWTTRNGSRASLYIRRC